jgi:hypothetical protein
MDNDKFQGRSFPEREQFDEEFDLTKLDPRNLPGYQGPGATPFEEFRILIQILRGGGS